MFINLAYQLTKKTIKMKTLLQQMYDSANWYGYTERNGKTYYPYTINQIAKRLNIKLSYNFYYIMI